jgi:hypothetical protein
MNKTTPSQSDYCRLKVAHHLRENLVLSLVAVSVVLVFRYLTSGEAERDKVRRVGKLARLHYIDRSDLVGEIRRTRFAVQAHYSE